MLVVLYNKQLYSLDLSWRVFENWKRTNPNIRVTIETLTSSTYKEEKEVAIKCLEDWSVYRNTQALMN